VSEPLNARTVFISDLHLGSRQSQPAHLLEFLRRIENCEKLYLVGDVFDIMALRRKFFWSEDTSTVVQKLLRLARKGTEIIYVPGNHDAGIRPLLEEYGVLNLGNIHVMRECIHTTADGRRVLVCHGDEFDGAMRTMGWLYGLGSMAYDFALFINRIYNWGRRLFGHDYWSLSAYLKSKVKDAVKFTSDFERMVAQAARDRGVKEVLCGHIHKAGITQYEDVTYYNDGDWCESLTAVIESPTGELSVYHHIPESVPASARETESMVLAA
jgi:UDP-2,3-diacylglucosamine pyrophosphatase LpxH